MKKILRVSSTMGVASLVKIFSGLARAKFLAWQLGPIGIGLVGQAQMFSVFAVQLCSLNIGMGVTKGVSEKIAKNEKTGLATVVDTANTFQFMASLVFILAVLPFSRPLTRFIFADGKYWPYFVGITLVTPFAIYLIGMATPIFYAFKRITDYTKLTVVSTIAGLGIFLGAVYFCGLDGVLLQIIITAVISFLIALYFLKYKLHLVPKIDLSIFRKPQARAVSSELFKYSVMSFLPGNITMLAMLLIRGLFMRQYGIEANGFFQVAYGVSAYYLPFVTNALWGHFYPEMCALHDKMDINRSLNEFIRFAVFASTLIAAGCVLFREYVIVILFSREFMKAYDLIAIQAMGDIFFVLFYMFNTSMMARKKFGGIIWIQTIGYNAVLLASYLLLRNIPSIDYRSFNIAIAVTNFLMVIAQAAYFRIDTGFIFSIRNTVHLASGIVLMGILCAIPDAGYLTFALKASLVAIWLFFSITRSEAKSFLGFVSAFFRKGDLSV